MIFPNWVVIVDRSCLQCPLGLNYICLHLMTVNLQYLLPWRCFQSWNSKRDQRMIDKADLVIIGVSAGLALGIVIASLLFFGIRWYKKRAHLRRCANERCITSATLPIRTNGTGTSTDFSASLTTSIAVQGSKKLPKSSWPSWWKHQNKDGFVSASGILRYSYKYVDFELEFYYRVYGQ